MHKIKKKGLIFFLIVIVYIILTVKLRLYQNNAVFLSYFGIAAIWVFLFSKHPLGGKSALDLVDLSRFINRITGKRNLPWTEYQKFTPFTLRDLLSSLLLFLFDMLVK